jgi:hypothetical protein
MNQTAVDDAAHDAPKRAGAVISGRALLLRAAIALVTVVTMSIGGAWLMYAAIDPAVDAVNGASAPVHVDASEARPGTR